MFDLLESAQAFLGGIHDDPNQSAIKPEIFARIKNRNNIDWRTGLRKGVWLMDKAAAVDTLRWGPSWNERETKQVTWFHSHEFNGSNPDHVDSGTAERTPNWWHYPQGSDCYLRR